MHISKVHSGKQYVNSKREPQKNMPGSDCEWRVLFSAVAPRKAEQRGREIREPTKSRGTQQGLSPRGWEKGDYRQVEPQPVISASGVQSQKDRNSSRIWIPLGLRELRGAGWTKHLDWNSSHLIQTLLCCPGCGSSFHFTQLTWAWRSRKELVPFLYTSRVPASCPLFSKHLPASGLPAFYAKPKRDDWNHLADIPWMCLEQKCCKTSGKWLPTRRKAHIYIPELKQAVPCYPNEKFPVFSGLKSSLHTYLQC